MNISIFYRNVVGRKVFQLRSLWLKGRKWIKELLPREIRQTGVYPYKFASLFGKHAFVVHDRVLEPEILFFKESVYW